MLTSYYSDPKAIDRLCTGLAGEFLDGFVGWLDSRKYSWYSVRSYVPAVVRFMNWLETMEGVDEIPNEISLGIYREHLKATGCLNRSVNSCASRNFVLYLVDSGIIPASQSTHPADPRLVTEFQCWMRQHRGIVDSTITGYCRVVRGLVKTIGSDPESYDARALRSYVLDQYSRNGTSMAKIIATSVRMFIRYLIATKQGQASLQYAIPKVAKWRQASLPRYINVKEVERIIACCDPSTPLGTRDRAIILLLFRLALRAGDVAGLNLDDIDWQRGMLLVAGKARRETWLPLPQDVGDAILHYLKTGRPKSENDGLFLISRAPYTPILSRQVSQTARRSIHRAGVSAPSYGAHLFRHSAATAMLRTGASLQDISAVLRHRSIETTTIYAKVDVRMLLQVALPWPGEVTSC